MDSGLVVGLLVAAVAVAGVRWSAQADGPVEGVSTRESLRRRVQISLGIFALFALVGLLTYVPDVSAIDTRLVHALHLEEGDWDYGILHAISGAGGKELVYWVPVLLLAAFRFRRAAFRFFASTLLGSAALSTFFKSVFHRVRPDLVAGHHADSFPSGHTLGATVIAGAVLVVWYPACRTGWQKALLLLATLSWPVLMAFARVSVGSHFPTDTLGSLALGAAWVCAAHALQSFWCEQPALKPEVAADPAPEAA